MAPPSPARVLVATSWTDPDDETIAQADRMANGPGDRLFACHVVPEAPWRGLDPGAKRAEAQRLRGVLAELVAICTDRSPDSIEAVVVSGAVVSRVVREGARLEVDLVVVGIRDDRRLARWLGATVGERVARRWRGAVLVARPSPARGPIMAAVHESSPARAVAVAAAAAARRSGASLAWVHAIDDRRPSWGMVAPFGPMWSPLAPDPVRLRERARVELERALSGVDLPGTARVATGRVARVLLAQAAALDARLLVVARDERRGWRRSIAVQLLRDAPCSVLIVPPPVER